MNKNKIKQIQELIELPEGIKFSIGNKEYEGIFSNIRIKKETKEELMKKFPDIEFFDLREGEDYIKEKYRDLPEKKMNKIERLVEKGEIDWEEVYGRTPTTIAESVLADHLGTVILDKGELILKEETDLEYLEYC